MKLLVRSHAMRESTSPPREAHNNGSSSSPHSPQSVDGEKKFVGNLSPNSANAKLNNNEPMFNSNLCPNQSPKQMRNTATSPTYRTPSRNGNKWLAPTLFSPFAPLNVESRDLTAIIFFFLIPTADRNSTRRQTRFSWSQVNLVPLKFTRQRIIKRRRRMVGGSRRRASGVPRWRERPTRSRNAITARRTIKTIVQVYFKRLFPRRSPANRSSTRPRARTWRRIISTASRSNVGRARWAFATANARRLSAAIPCPWAAGLARGTSWDIRILPRVVSTASPLASLEVRP